MKPVRVHRQRTRGWKSPERTKTVCRPGKFGNPFATAEAFRNWIDTGAVDKSQLLDWIQISDLPARRADILSSLGELRGWNLSCFCLLDRDCHGDYLLELANRQTEWLTDNGNRTAYGAVFSPDRLHRYTLWRRWSFDEDRLCAFIGLNPSTADEFTNDPTVTRCIRRAQTMGFTGMVMLNLFGYRATDPRDMKSFPEPVGWQNDDAIVSACKASEMVIACWGAHGTHRDRELHVRRMLAKAKIRVHCLALTQNGHPRHPLYLRNSATPQLFSLTAKV